MKGLTSIGVKEFKNKTLWIIYVIICLFVCFLKATGIIKIQYWRPVQFLPFTEVMRVLYHTHIFYQDAENYILLKKEIL